MKNNYSLILCAFLSFSGNIFSQNKFLDSLIFSRAQSENFRNSLEFMQEPSTVSGTRFFDYHSGIKKAYLFDGDFQIPMTIGGKKFISGKKYKFYHAFQFIPQVKVRIFQNDPKWNDKSKPVRTPSYYPKLFYYLSSQSFWNTKNKYNFFLALGLSHHSNGQEGTEFVDFSDTVNIYNGSFSESLIEHFQLGGSIKFSEKEAHYFNKIARKKTQKIIESASTRSSALYWKFSYENHPKFFANQKFYQTGVYGGNRLSLNLSFLQSNLFDTYYHEKNKWKSLGEKIMKENFRVTLNTEYITDLSFYSGGFNHLKKIQITDFKKRANIILTAYKRIFDAKYLSIFCQIAYFGSDNYNIYFQKSIFQAKVGLAFGFFEYEKR